MTKDEKKRRLAEWKAKEKAVARDRLPLPPNELRELFAYLDQEVPRQGCDHTRRLTLAWLEGRGDVTERTLAWLDGIAAFCDCEVAMNAEQALEEAI